MFPYHQIPYSAEEPIDPWPLIILLSVLFVGTIAYFIGV